MKFKKENMNSVILILFTVFVVIITTVASTDLEVSSKEIFNEHGSLECLELNGECNKNTNTSKLLDFAGLVNKYEGYSVEEYDLTTEDGYILKLHRISASPSAPKFDGKPVVYVQHGLMSSPDILVALGPSNSIVFALADAGYDVWLGNLRGNSYSRRHVKYQASSLRDIPRFWDFRMDEMAEYDLPQFIDFVLKETNQKSLTYVGVSLGAAVIYMLLSSKPEYNEKVNLIANFGPAVCFLSPVHPMLEFHMATFFTAHASSYEVMPQSSITGEFFRQYCGRPGICSTILSMYVDTKRVNLEALAPYVTAGTSYYTVRQYHQIAHANGKLRKYDYGTCYMGMYMPYVCEKDNWSQYGQRNPPEYDLSLVTAPSALFYAENDIVTRVKDVEYLKTQLKNVVAFEKVSDPLFNHLDNVVNNDAKSVVFDPLLEVISRYIKNE